jgi:peptidylprolyl isomerase
MPEQAQKGDTVQVHYEGSFEDGEVFDSSADGDPLEFKVGAGEVIKGFDEGVQGMGVGDKKRIEISVEDAYGERNETHVWTVPREGFNLGTEPQAGMTIIMGLPEGQEIPVVVTSVTEESITLDANHPLAGKKLIFEVNRVK